MEARKFIKKNRIEENGISYLITKCEVRDVNISKYDWNWIYENIMYDDYECARDNGFYETETDFYSIDCQRVLEQFNEWKEELSDNGEKFEDYNDDFKDTYNNLHELLEHNIDFTIYYEDKDN